MNQEAVMVPIGDWAKSRLSNLSETDLIEMNLEWAVVFINVSNWLSRDKVYPNNVLYLATECSNQNHSAAFPVDLPLWFIKLFTKPGELVLDPFIGSGTTAYAAVSLGRNYLGVEVKEDYIQHAQYRLNNAQIHLPIIAEELNTYSTEKGEKNE